MPELDAEESSVSEEPPPSDQMVAEPPLSPLTAILAGVFVGAVGFRIRRSQLMKDPAQAEKETLPAKEERGS